MIWDRLFALAIPIASNEYGIRMAKTRLCARYRKENGIRRQQQQQCYEAASTSNRYIPIAVCRSVRRIWYRVFSYITRLVPLFPIHLIPTHDSSHFALLANLQIARTSSSCKKCVNTLPVAECGNIMHCQVVFTFTIVAVSPNMDNPNSRRSGDLSGSGELLPIKTYSQRLRGRSGEEIYIRCLSLCFDDSFGCRPTLEDALLGGVSVKKTRSDERGFPVWRE